LVDDVVVEFELAVVEALAVEVVLLATTEEMREAVEEEREGGADDDKDKLAAEAPSNWN
jgi:hypothetical protein